MITTIKFFKLLNDNEKKNSIPINNKYTYHVNGMFCQTEQELYDHFIKELKFPYFGRNWDALIDSLSDFCWILTNKVTIYLSNIEYLLLEESEKKNIFYEILFIDIVNRYKETIFEDLDEYVTLNLVFITNSENEKLIDSLFKEYNITQSEIHELL